MGNSDSKEEVIIKCSFEDMVRHFFKDYVVVWHDPNVNSPENQQYIMQLKQFCDVLTFTDHEKALASIQESKAACQVITSGTNGEVLVEKIYESNNLARIYVFCMNKEYHSTWAQKYLKVSCVETNIQTLIDQIKQNLLEWYREISSMKVNLPAFAPIFNDGDKSQISHLHRYLKIISSYENRSQAKKDFLNLSKLIYTDPNNTKHIADFEKYYTEYNKPQILRWYTRESFLYKVTNNCLRIATSDSIQYCRFLLKDLEQAIKDQYQAKSKNFNGLLYRGAYLSQEEWTNLKENQEKEIEMHGFLSVSKEKNVALTFMQTSSSQKVLITIIVPKGPTQEKQGFAEIEDYSFFPQEREILFNVRSRFTVLETEDEYSSELPYRHLVLLYGAQGFRKFTAEKNPVVKVTTLNLQDLSCCHCIQETPENFILRPLDKQIYYCKHCLEKSESAAFLCVPLKNTPPTLPEINIKGCLLNSNQLDIPFYGYKCSQCQAKKQKRYFVCTDCSQPTWWCENCFTETVPCIQANHNILLESIPFTFWCQRMSENELNHIKFQNNLISEIFKDDEQIFRQARMYSQSHNYDKAIEYYSLYLQRSKKKIIDVYREDAYTSLGDAYIQKREYEKALEYHLKALEALPFFMGVFNPQPLAASYGNVGKAYQCLGNYAKAREYYLKTLDIFKKLGEEESLAISYCHIGVTYEGQGEYSKALEYHFKALEIKKHLEKGNAPGIATSYDYIASVFEKQKEYAKALEYHFKSLNIRKPLYGEIHPQIAISYRDLALIFSSQKEYEKALEYRLKALQIQKIVSGENSSRVADDYRKIGTLYKDWKQYTTALEYHLKSLDIKRSLHGEDHADIALAYDSIGHVYLDQKEHTKAFEYYLKSLEIKKLLSAENTGDIATSYENLGKALNGQGEYNKALEYHFKALNIKKEVYGENRFQVASSYSNIVDVYMNQKEHRKALEYAMKALEIDTLVYGKDRPGTAESQKRVLEIQSALL